MRTSVLFIIAMLAVFACTGLEAAKAVPVSGVTVADFQSNPGIEEVGWRRRWYRGYAYPAPYAYYPPPLASGVDRWPADGRVRLALLVLALAERR